MNRQGWGRQVVLAGMFIALAVIVPVVFHMIGDLGQVFLPMHLPLLVAGAFLMPVAAFLTGILAPLLSSLLTGMPQIPLVYILVPEMAAYALLFSILWRRARKKKGREPRGFAEIIPVLLPVMLLGRLVRVAASYLFLPLLMGIPFSPGVVASAVFIQGLPGIILQLVLVPLLLDRTSVLREKS